MKSNLKVVNIWAAGGVIINKEGISVILCYREKDSLWTLPKGKPEENETKEITSLREVKEETGLEVKIIEKIGTTNHKFQNDNYASKLIDYSNYKNIIFHKKVHWYLMDYTGGNTKYHDDEFDIVKWITLNEAISLLTYKNESKILEKAISIFKKHN